MMYFHSKDSVLGGRHVHHREESVEEGSQCRMTIDRLPDDALLEIFDFCREGTMCGVGSTWMWGILVHVCRRWRCIIFASPRRLDLRLVCTHKTPVRKSLDIWPPLPINIRRSYKGEGGEEEDILAAFEQRDRVVEIVLDGVTPSTVVSLVTVMQESFPVLRHLFLGSNYTPLYLPNAFFCGLGPSLRSLVLENVLLPSQALHKVLSSATHLVKLWLLGLPYTPFSPEAIATYIATLPNLEDLRIGFQRPRIYAYQATPPLLTPTILPALTSFQFSGPCGYLEDLVPLIDTPKLQTLSITFINRRVHVAQLRRFISRVGWPKPPNRATVEFGILDVGLRFTSSDSFELAIRCSHLAGQLSSMTRVCDELSPLLSHVGHLQLSVSGNRLASRLVRPFDFTQWLQFLRRFMTVRDLYVSKKLGSSLAYALQELTGERSAEVLPELCTLFLEDFQPSAVESFVAARKLSDRPVNVLHWMREPNNE